MKHSLIALAVLALAACSDCPDNAPVDTQRQDKGDLGGKDYTKPPPLCPKDRLYHLPGGPSINVPQGAASVGADGKR